MTKSAPYITANEAELIKIFNQLGYKHSKWEVFQDWVQILADAISNSVDFNHREQREKEYMQTIKKYDKEERMLLVKLSNTLVDVLEREVRTHGPTDVLGKLFHSLELHNKFRGQFFTPGSLADGIGEISMSDVDMNKLKRKGYISVLEPAVGSGCMIIGAVKALQKRGVNYCEEVCVTACDIDIKCVHMAYIQLALYGVPAVVIHGNTLTLEEWSQWYTPTYMLGMWPIKDGIRDILDFPHEENAKTPKRQKSEPVKKEEPPQLILKDSGQFSFI